MVIFFYNNKFKILNSKANNYSNNSNNPNKIVNNNNCNYSNSSYNKDSR
jgi:hypothetical protein